MALVPYTDEHGLRDFRATGAPSAADPRVRPALVVCAFLVGIWCGLQLTAWLAPGR